LAIVAAHGNEATLSRAALARNGRIVRLPLAPPPAAKPAPPKRQLAQILLSWLNQMPEVQAIPNQIEPN
ncbi:MAG: hypothetical protein ACLQVY_08480, partial [Limisphaerales bacterium]